MSFQMLKNFKKIKISLVFLAYILGIEEGIIFLLQKFTLMFGV